MKPKCRTALFLILLFSLTQCDSCDSCNQSGSSDTQTDQTESVEEEETNSDSTEESTEQESVEEEVVEDESQADQTEEETEEAFSVTSDFETISELIDYLSTTQNDDGSFDWQRDVNDALTPSTTGFQNVTGITALGYFALLEIEENATWRAVVNNVASYLDDYMDTYLADVENESVSCPNFTFLSWYLQDTSDSALQVETITVLNTLLDDRDDDYGDDSSVRVDGIINRIIDGRSSIPGIIPWDIALCVESLEAMAEISDDFSTDYTDALTSLINYLNDTFIPAYDVDNTLTYADLSLSFPLYVIAKSSSAGDYTTIIAQLTERVEALVNAAGEVTNSSDKNSRYQATAYGLMALKQIESSSSQNTQTFLESLVDEDGKVYDPDTDTETFEIEGEILRALAM